jgi:hypothetical protein
MKESITDAGELHEHISLLPVAECLQERRLSDIHGIIEANLGWEA